MPLKIYVASSWRNKYHQDYVKLIQDAGHEVYDFKNPIEGQSGFHWSDVGMPSYDRGTNGPVPVEEYIVGLQHPLAELGFSHDKEGMLSCDACLMVLPCGASAHLELGWFLGMGMPGWIVIPTTEVIPELMYRLADTIFPGPASLDNFLRSL